MGGMSGEKCYFGNRFISLGSDVEGLNYLGYVMIDHTSVTMYYYLYIYI